MILDGYSKYEKLLRLDTIKDKRVKLTKSRKSKSDMSLIFEQDGGFVKEYFIKKEDAIHILRKNNNRLVYSDDDKFVFSLLYGMYCILS